MTRLNLGAGSNLKRGWDNIDRVALPGIDYTLDLDYHPWPWSNGSVSAIEADNLFEHVQFPILFMTECHRILKPAGTLRIITPEVRNPASWTDPTHRRHCTMNTFDYWIPGTIHYKANNAAYGGVSFTPVSIELRADMMIDAILRKL